MTQSRLGKLVTLAFGAATMLALVMVSDSLFADGGKDPKQGPPSKEDKAKCVVSASSCDPYTLCTTDNNDCVVGGQTITYQYAKNKFSAEYGYCAGQDGPDYCLTYPSVECATIQVYRTTSSGTCFDPKCTFTYYVYGACTPPANPN